ncbi:hypothetical protein [Thermococcus sp.]
MRKALVVVTLMLLMAPFVSALSYYPNERAFLTFLHSNSTFRVVPGESYWSRGWAYYVDAKLSEIKKHGNGVIVLVGNVRDNPETARLWNRTGLDPSKSFEPGVIVLNGTIFVTGSETNIYETERAFSQIWEIPPVSFAVFGMIAFAVVLVFGLTLRRDRSYAARFYLLSASLIFVWFTTSLKPMVFANSFLVEFFQALQVAVGGSSTNPTALVLGNAFRFIPPTEENVWLGHWLLLLILAGLLFYTAPKRERELGFITFGLLFSSPAFRRFLTPGPHLLGLVLTVAIVAVIANSTFVPERRNVLQTLLLTALTVFGMLFNPYLVLFPIFFAITFPGRPLRNLIYLFGTLIVGVYLYRIFGMDWLGSWIFGHFNLWCLQEFILQSLLALTLVLYAALFGKGRRKGRGTTAFLGLSTATFIGIGMFLHALMPYGFFLLSILATRVLHSIIQT